MDSDIATQLVPRCFGLEQQAPPSWIQFRAPLAGHSNAAFGKTLVGPKTCLRGVMTHVEHLHWQGVGTV